MYPVIFKQIPIDQMWFYFLVMFVLEGIAVYTWQFRKMPGAMPLVLLQTGKGLWLLCLIMSTMYIELANKLFWINLEQIISISVTYISLAVVLAISNQAKYISIKVKMSLRCLLVFLGVAVLTNEWHGLYWVSSSWELDKVVLMRGPLAWVALCFSYFNLSASIILSIRWVGKAVGLRRWQAIGLTIASSISVVGHFLWIIFKKLPLSPVPVCFLLSGILLTWVYYRWQMYSIMPFAQEAVSRKMVDGLMVIDEQEYIVEVNSTAAEIVTELMPAVVGKKFHDVLAVWPELAMINTNQDVYAGKVSLTHGGTERHYQLHVTPLQNKQGYYLGKVLVLKDVTQQQQNQKKMLEHHKVNSILTERNRLGRELHDVQGQFTAYVKTQTQTIKVLLKEERWGEAVKQVESLSQVADESFFDVRESIAGLKMATDEWDFFETMQEWLGRFQKMSGIPAVYSGPTHMPARWIAPEAEVQLLRIIQETLANTRKYADASSVKVNFAFTSERLVVTVEDDGCGFDPEDVNKDTVKFGLGIIQERALEIDGTCRVRSLHNQGTVMTIEIPLVGSCES